MNTETDRNPAPQLRHKRSYWAFKILFPVAIGLGVVAWMFHREFDAEMMRQINFDSRLTCSIALAWLFMAGRDFGLSWRFRALTDNQLRWGQAIRVNFLCEFTSCMTPSAVGGSSLGMIFLHSEGIELGRATTLMITTLFLDELFFVVALPIAMFAVPYAELFNFNTEGLLSMGLQTVFWIVYAGICIWTAILFTGILIKPDAVKRLLMWLTKLRWLRRWQGNMEALGDNMAATGLELRKRSWRWWGEAFLGTVLSWSSRYLVVNALFFGFAAGAPQMLVFARQFVIWVVLMVSPTPGGSGISEWLFTEYYGDLIAPSVALIMALFWRIISYYVYLAAGACLLPGFIRRSLGHKSIPTK